MSMRFRIAHPEKVTSPAVDGARLEKSVDETETGHSLPHTSPRRHPLDALDRALDLARTGQPLQVLHYLIRTIKRGWMVLAVREDGRRRWYAVPTRGDGVDLILQMGGAV